MSFFGWASLAAQAYGAYSSYKAGKKQQTALADMVSAQNRAKDLQIKQNNLRMIREKRRTIREARIKRAQAMSAATIQGAAGAGSSAFGGIGSIKTQGTSNLNFLQQSGIFANQGTQELKTAALFGSQATKYAGQAATYKGLQSMGQSIFTNRKDITGFFKNAGIFS